MRIACLLSFALLTAPALAATAEENVTVKLRGALVEFESGAQYAFYPRGGFLVTGNDGSYRGNWTFKPDRSAYCVTVGSETACRRIVKQAERYVEFVEGGEVAGAPIKRIKFNHFKK